MLNLSRSEILKLKSGQCHIGPATLAKVIRLTVDSSIMPIEEFLSIVLGSKGAKMVLKDFLMRLKNSKATKKVPTRISQGWGTGPTRKVK